MAAKFLEQGDQKWLSDSRGLPSPPLTEPARMTTLRNNRADADNEK